MFGLGGAERRRRSVALISRTLPGAVEALHPVERATVLVLANAMLRAAAAAHGPGLESDPAAAGPAAAHAALADMSRQRDRVSSIVADPRSPHPRHAALDLRALELSMLTVGVAVEPSVLRACSASWKAAWEGRGRIRDAVAWMRRYEAESGVPAAPLPAGTASPSDLDLARVGASVPEFLRRRS